MVILNTCHIREKAAEKLFSELGRLRGLKAERRQAWRRADHRRGGLRRPGRRRGDPAPRPACRYRARAADLSSPARDGGASPPRGAGAAARYRISRRIEIRSSCRQRRARPGVTAFLSVQEGCDKFCTFCVVPYTRGAESSRPAAAVLAEAESLVARGAREITLLGQNVNAYHGAGPDGADMGPGAADRRAGRIPGLARIRYTTSHPADMDEELIAAHGEEPKLMPFLHLPVQSGSDRILAAMNRKHRAADYLDLHRRAAAPARPDIALSIGFHRRLSRRERSGFRRHAGADRG